MFASASPSNSCDKFAPLFLLYLGPLTKAEVCQGNRPSMAQESVNAQFIRECLDTGATEYSDISGVGKGPLKPPLNLWPKKVNIPQ